MKARRNASMCWNAIEIKCSEKNDTWGTFPWWAYPWPWLALSLIVLMERWPSWTALTNGWHNHGPPARDTALTDPASQTEALTGAGRLPDIPSSLYRSFSSLVSFSLSIPSWICERLIARLVSGISNLQQRNTPLHRQRFSWSLGYVPWIRKIIERESVYGKTKINRRIPRGNTKIRTIFTNVSETLYIILNG